MALADGSQNQCWAWPAASSAQTCCWVLMTSAVGSWVIPEPQVSCEMLAPDVHHQCSSVPPLPRAKACCSPLLVTKTLGRPTTPDPHVSCCTPFVLGPQYQCWRLPAPSTAHTS